MATSNVLSRSAKRLVVYRRFSVSSSRNQNVWTPDNIVKSPYRDIEITNKLIADHIWENLDKWADKTAVMCGLTNRSYSYHQVYKQSRNFAAKLRTKLQIRDGDVVCIMMPNLPEYSVVVLGVLQSGATCTTANPIYTAHEVSRQLNLSNPKVVITTSETVKVMKDALQLVKKNIPVITVKTINEDLPLGTISFKELAEDNTDHSVLNEVRRNPEDVAFLPYSSGTTGLPKGVELTHRNIVVNLLQQDVDGVKQYNDTTNSHQDSVMAVLPFYHIYGLSIIMLHKLTSGSKIVSLPKFQPNLFLNALKQHRISLLYAAPPMVLYLGSHPDVTKEHLDSVEKLMCGAAPLPKQDIDRVLNRANPKLKFIQLYGLTETSPLVSTMVPGSENYTSAGFAIPSTELKVVDSNNRNLGPNQIGELLIRGPQVMKGYRNNPEATKETITEDGWFKSGDLVSIDKDGALYISDRLKELIKVKGFQVPPAELESVLKEHPDVLDAGIVGVPDERLGEAPKAFVVLKEGSKIKTEDVINFVKERVAEFKRLKEVVFLNNLPKNPSGKLLRRVLKEKYC